LDEYHPLVYLIASAKKQERNRNSEGLGNHILQDIYENSVIVFNS
jgi:hypothetical protein